MARTFGGTLDAVVTDTRGNTLAGINVHAWATATGGTALGTTVSGVDGSFELTLDTTAPGVYVSAGTTGPRRYVPAREAVPDLLTSLANKTNNATTAALSDRVDTTETRVGTVEDDLAGRLSAPVLSSTLAPIGEAFRPLKAAAIGTSIMAGGLRSTDGIVVQTGNTWAPMSAAGVQQGGPQSWFTYAALLSGGRLLHHFNASIASDTMQGAIARFQTDVVDKAPEVVFLGDPTNEINNAATNAEIRARVAELVRLSRAAGIVPILTTATPQNDTAKAQRVREHNVWVRRYASDNSIHLVDPYAALVDPASSTGAFLAAYSGDGLHPNTAGALAAGQKVLADLAGLLRGNADPKAALFVPQDSAANPNLLTNPLFYTDGNSDGKSDGWSHNGTGATFTLETDAAVVGKVQKVVIASSSGSLYQQKSIDGTTFSAGDRIAYSGLAKVSAGGSLVWYPQLYFAGQVGAYAVMPMAAGTADMPWFAYYCEAVVPAGCTFFRAGLFTNAGVGTLWAAQQRVVNLTKLGLA